MDNDVFDQLIGKRKLGQRSIDAARLVLVDGKRQIEASQETGVVPSQLSRVVAMLEKEESLLKATSHSSEPVIDEISLSYAKAVKRARDLKGESIVVDQAPENGRSRGEVLFKEAHHLVQDIGGGKVMIHESWKINQLPPDGHSVELIYKKGFAEARQNLVQKERGSR